MNSSPVQIYNENPIPSDKQQPFPFNAYLMSDSSFNKGSRRLCNRYPYDRVFTATNENQ